MFMNQENRNQVLLMWRNPQLKDSAACIPKKKRYTKVIKVKVTYKVLVSFFLYFYLPTLTGWWKQVWQNLQWRNCIFLTDNIVANFPMRSKIETLSLSQYWLHVWVTYLKKRQTIRYNKYLKIIMQSINAT